MNYIVVSGLLSALSISVTLAQGNLTVNVTGFGNGKGHCKLWLFNAADGFPSDDEKALRCVETPITGSASRYVFEKLPVGSYAIGVIHDQNGHHRLDANFLGIPKEAYGISNDARGGIGGPPTFDQATVTVPQNGLTILIKVH